MGGFNHHGDTPRKRSGKLAAQVEGAEADGASAIFFVRGEAFFETLGEFQAKVRGWREVCVDGAPGSEYRGESGATRNTSSK